MELNLKTNLTEDFSTVCDIFQIKPESIVQSIIDRISFPYFFTHQHEIGRWPTLLFLEFLDEDHHHESGELELHEPYMNRIAELIERAFAVKDDDQAKSKAEQAARGVMREWHNAVLKHRAKYLLDNLPDGE
jgi:hypothetical protein